MIEKHKRVYSLKKGCPLSPSLFAIYLSDIEEVMKKGQDGGIVIGSYKIWTLYYADDLVILAKTKGYEKYDKKTGELRAKKKINIKQ